MNNINDIMKVIALEAINLPTFKEVRGKDWVAYGENNLFPLKLVELLQTSAIHNTAIRSKLDAVIGEGVAEIGDLVVNTKGETLNDVYDKIALDYLTFGGFSLNTIWNRGGDKVVEFYHLPFVNVRSGKLNEEDKVTEYFYSSHWQNVRKYPPMRYSAYNPLDTKGDNASQIFYHYDYSPASDVYPLPDYIAAANDIELDARIAKFHNANISNGMSPSLFITLTNGDPTPEEKRKLYQGIVDSYTGVDNAGRVFLSFVDGAEKAPIINTVPSANDSYYIVLEERITSRILTAHRITSPLLIGIRDGGGLGSNSEEIQVAYTHFLSTVIQPIQKSINRSLSLIMRAFGVDTPVVVIPSKLDFNQNIDIQNG